MERVLSKRGKWKRSTKVMTEATRHISLAPWSAKQAMAPDRDHDHEWRLLEQMMNESRSDLTLSWCRSNWLLLRHLGPRQRLSRQIRGGTAA